MKNIINIIIISVLLVTVLSCKEEDLLAPEITLVNGNDTLLHVLNTVYDEPGFSATDNVDGDIKDRVYITNNVDINLVGTYTVEYTVVDEVGNEANTKTRIVEVYNQGRTLQGNYLANNSILFPETEDLQYQTQIFADTTINNRLYFNLFADTLALPVYFNKTSNTVIELPLQSYTVDTINYTFSGNGILSDNHIEIDYIKKENDITHLAKIVCDRR